MTRQFGKWRLVLAGALLGTIAAGACWAQNISIDGHFSPAQTLIGPNYAIPASLGRQVGANLFHSFGQFGLTQGESANFSGPASVANIIGRVTGGQPSSIDGAINSSIAGANLYLINPSGMVFGPHATVNVSGAFHASTADYLRLSDGARFQATNPEASTLSAAPPAAFGFINTSPPAITVDGSQLGPGPSAIGMIGGPVAIANGARLAAPGGTIHVAAAAGSGEVPVDPGDTAGLSVTRFAPVQISGATLDVSNPSGAGGSGSVLVRGGDLSISAGEFNADNYGAAAGGQIALHGDGAVALSGGANIHAATLGTGSGASLDITTPPTGAASLDAATVSTSSAGSGQAGPLSVTTGQLSLLSGGALTSTAQAGGGGGAIAITAASVLLDGGAAMNQSTGIASTTSGSAPGGAITVTANQLALHNGAGVIAESHGAGAGGTVTASLGGTLTVDSGASFGTLTSGGGNAGDVAVTVAGPVTVDMTTGASASTLDGIGSLTAGTGNAGNVAVNAAALTISNYGQVSSTTFRVGNAGNISVNVSGQLAIQSPTGEVQADTGLGAESEDGGIGNAGNVTVSAGSIAIGSSGRPVIGFQRVANNGFVDTEDDLTGITGQAEGRGHEAGIVTVRSAGDVTITDGGVITAQTFGLASGGAVRLIAQGPLMVSGAGSGIFASAASRATGDAGSVSVSAPQITLSGGAAVASTAAGPGAGGSVEVTTPGALTIDGAGVAGTQIAASATGPQSGAGGAVTVNAGTLTIENGGQVASSTAGPGRGGEVAVTVAGDAALSGPGPQISASSTGSGDAGSITLAAANMRLSGGAAISTEAATANGGNITLAVGRLLELDGSAVTTSVMGAAGNGGNILIDPRFLVLQHGSIVAQAVRGHGGNITIVADEFLPSVDSTVSASSQLGVSGTIEVVGPRVDLNGSLVVLSSELRSAAEVLRGGCATQGDLPQSSLTEAGRGGLPQDPDTTIPALYLADLKPFPAEATRAAGTVAAATQAAFAVPPMPASALRLAMPCH